MSDHFGSVVFIIACSIAACLSAALLYKIISSRARAEAWGMKQTLETLADSIGEGVILLNARGNVQIINPAAEELLCVGHSELMGKKVVPGIFPKGFPTGIYKIPRRNGTYFHASVITAPYIHMGAILGTIISFQDVTERVHAEQELRNINQNLSRMVEEAVVKTRNQESIIFHQSRLNYMSDMINAVAHQWRQPLTAISLLVQDIEDARNYEDTDADYVKDTVRKTMNYISTMSRTIDNFRDYFKPSSEKAYFDLIESLKLSVYMFMPILKNQSISVIISFMERCEAINGEESEGAGEVLLYGYAQDFRTAFIHILKNAIDAIVAKDDRFDRHIDINVSVDADRCTITTADSGTGIDEQCLHNIFDPYYTTKDQGAGVGLGLYQSKLIIVNYMNGEIYAENSQGGGAVFTIRLPVQNVSGG